VKNRSFFDSDIQLKASVEEDCKEWQKAGFSLKNKEKYVKSR
jgi:hypothetical protein